MEQVPGHDPQPDKQRLKKAGSRALIANIVFFVVLFGGMFLVPLSGIYVAAAVIIIAFIVSMLYIYLF
ncbi:MAG: hypothetical protein AB1767_06260 [Bacillota bacterium]